MNANQYTRLFSEVDALKTLLSQIPEENVIDRIGLEYRLGKVQEELNAVNPYHINKKAKLTFRGSPVHGSEAISARFAAKATYLFSEAISTLSASFENVLHSMGPIPDSQFNQLMITNTAIGSFGFEFELPKADETDLCPNPSIVEKAIEEAQKLFEVAATGTDDQLSDIVDEVNPRAIKKVHDFLGFLNDQDSWCGLEFNNHFFRFSDRQQLEKAVFRLKDDNIHEERVPFTGKFEGVLPVSRTFEFRTSIDNELIKGKIDGDILNPEIINKEWLLKPVTIQLTITRVGNSRPKFTLISLEDIYETPIG
ncbi:hypothetical protein [Alkanindiges illinoisensis]|uniref:Uncharacterized protein n=1 Tax=Alkanindiges illinoisensis TaxID=197183 RepID=A0A4Y7X975_9GAMM|nr:hypothetical protein [Alkanindiges illinoisensis]TEU23346.1 hypothetical protein E2B99_13590 [Alkanindiges illinoisensis]